MNFDISYDCGLGFVIYLYPYPVESFENNLEALYHSRPLPLPSIIIPCTPIRDHLTNRNHRPTSSKRHIIPRFCSGFRHRFLMCHFPQFLLFIPKLMEEYECVVLFVARETVVVHEFEEAVRIAHLLEPLGIRLSVGSGSVSVRWGLGWNLGWHAGVGGGIGG